MVLSQEKRRQLLSPFVEVMADVRDLNGLTQSELAEMADVSTKYVGLVERGQKVPQVETLLAMMAEAGVRRNEASELVGELLDQFEWRA